MNRPINNMKKCRVSKGFSMKDLSFASGISERYLYFIENGERNPSINTAKKIAKALDESIEYIFFGEIKN